MSARASLTKALRQRWQDSGLSDLYGTLYEFGGSDTTSTSGVIGSLAGGSYVPGSPQEAPLPRSEFMVGFDHVQLRTGNSLVRVVPATINVFTRTSQEADEALDRMFESFVDAESAEVDPMEIPPSQGCIVAVDYDSGVKLRVKSNIYVARLHATIAWCEPRT